MRENTQSGGGTMFFKITATLFIAAFLLSGAPAMAHKVMVFAWAEGEMVHTESKFSGGKKVNHGKISVMDGKGEVLLAGETDDAGKFSFRAPVRETLTIVMDSGMGHRAEWTLPAHELAATLTSSGIPENADVRGNSDLQKKNGVLEKSEVSAGGSLLSGGLDVPLAGKGEKAGGSVLSEADIRMIEAAVDRALDRKLAPLKKTLAEEKGAGPKVNEIFSGIGYILGLAGVGIYFNNRKSRS